MKVECFVGFHLSTEDFPDGGLPEGWNMVRAFQVNGKWYRWPLAANLSSKFAVVPVCPQHDSELKEYPTYSGSTGTFLQGFTIEDNGGGDLLIKAPDGSLIRIGMQQEGMVITSPDCDLVPWAIHHLSAILVKSRRV